MKLRTCRSGLLPEFLYRPSHDGTPSLGAFANCEYSTNESRSSELSGLGRIDTDLHDHFTYTTEQTEQNRP